MKKEVDYRSQDYNKIDWNERWIGVDILAGLVLYHRKYCVVEIGVGPHPRSSTGVLMRRAEERNVKIYTCDTSSGKNKLMKEFYNYPKHIHFHGTSEKFMEQFDDTPAVVFIDGFHSAEMVLKEFNFFFPRLVEGGIIMMHDTFPNCDKNLIPQRCGDVYKARQELEKSMNCFTWPYTAANVGLSMIIKHDENRPYYRR